MQDRQDRRAARHDERLAADRHRAKSTASTPNSSPTAARSSARSLRRAPRSYKLRVTPSQIQRPRYHGLYTGRGRDRQGVHARWRADSQRAIHRRRAKHSRCADSQRAIRGRRQARSRRRRPARPKRVPARGDVEYDLAHGAIRLLKAGRVRKSVLAYWAQGAVEAYSVIEIAWATSGLAAHDRHRRS